MSKVTIRAALERVNQVRDVLGFEPLDKMPKGILSNPGNCPIHNALGFHDNNVDGMATLVYSRTVARKIAKVWGTRVYDSFKDGNIEGTFCYDNDYDFDEMHKVDPRWVIVNPQEITDFINEFDNGRFRSLITPEDDD